MKLLKFLTEAVPLGGGGIRSQKPQKGSFTAISTIPALDFDGTQQNGTWAP